MSRVFVSQAAFDDLLRREEFLTESGDPLAGDLLEFILDALQVLTHQPGIGRPVEGGLRELINGNSCPRAPARARVPDS